MKSVLIGVDRSRPAQRAFRFALEDFHANESTLTLVHVVNEPTYRFPTLADNQKRHRDSAAQTERVQKEILDPFLEWARREELLGDFEINTRVLFGRPSEVLADLAVWEKHDLIVVARTGESNLRNAIFGSTAERLVQHSGVPVVVVP